MGRSWVMFSETGLLIRLGVLSDILDGNGSTLHVMNYYQLDSSRYKIEATVIAPGAPVLNEHEGFIIPTLSPFDGSLRETLVGTNFKIRKVLIATTTFTSYKDVRKSYELGVGHFTELYSSALPTLSGCAQLLPLSDAEKLICHINGISYE